MSYKILLVDDDPLILESSKYLLTTNGFQVDTALDGQKAIQKVSQNPHTYALVVLDYRMKGLDGSATVVKLRELSPELFILIYSGDSSRDAITSTWKAGAVGFLEKGNSAKELLETVRNWCRKYEETICTMPVTSVSEIQSLKMVGKSDALKEIASKVQKYKELNQSVLILGETGTGKELVANALKSSEDSPFLAINCASYRGGSDLLESELFGHEKGAFTGADREKKGIFELANNGTIFLDELHQLSASAQAKLLRVIQERKIRRVGGSQERSVSFRLVCASKPDILERCESGEFLSDLYHRVNVLSITIPPLRARPEDIAPLIEYFCAKHEAETGMKKRLLLRTLRYLETYDWPGNVRELENSIYQLLTDSPGEKIGPEQLDPKFFKEKSQGLPDSYAEFKKQQQLQEKAYLAKILTAAKSKSDAARRLGISPTTLHSAMQRNSL